MRLKGIYYEKIEKSLSNGYLVLLHSLTGNTARWDEYLNGFKKDYNILLIDLLGHGKSESPKNLNSFKPEFQSKIILEILKKEKIKKSNIICHSYSFNISLDLLKKNPSKFKRMIAISPFFLDGNKNAQKKLNKIKIAIKFWDLLPNIQKKGSFYYPKKGKGFTFKNYYEAIKEIGIKSYFGSVFTCLIYNTFANTNKIKLPILIIYKKDDNLLPKESLIILKKKINNLQTNEILGKSHLFLVDDKKTISSNIKSFLRDSTIMHRKN